MCVPTTLGEASVCARASEPETQHFSETFQRLQDFWNCKTCFGQTHTQRTASFGDGNAVVGDGFGVLHNAHSHVYIQIRAGGTCARRAQIWVIGKGCRRACVRCSHCPLCILSVHRIPSPPPTQPFPNRITIFLAITYLGPNGFSAADSHRAPMAFASRE